MEPKRGWFLTVAAVLFLLLAISTSSNRYWPMRIRVSFSSAAVFLGCRMTSLDQRLESCCSCM